MPLHFNYQPIFTTQDLITALPTRTHGGTQMHLSITKGFRRSVTDAHKKITSTG